MDSPQFLEQEIAFYKKRIDQVKLQVGQMQSVSQALMRQLTSNDDVLGAYMQKHGGPGLADSVADDQSVKSSSKSRKVKVGKVSTASYPSVIDQILGTESKDGVDSQLLKDVYAYQMKAIEKMQAKLKAKDEKKKAVEIELKEVRRQTDRIEKVAKELDKSREKAKVRILSMMQEENDLKNKAVYMNIDISKDELVSPDEIPDKSPIEAPKSLKGDKDSKLVRKSTAKLKPMKTPLE